jgi:hypothetical protein
MPLTQSERDAYARTLASATNNGDAWTSRDIARVDEARDVRDEDLARELGRTLFAIRSLRQALINGRASREGRDVTRRASSRTLPYDLGFTTIPDEW